MTEQRTTYGAAGDVLATAADRTATGLLAALANAGYVVLPRGTAEAFYDLALENDHHLSLREHYPIFEAALAKGSS